MHIVPRQDIECPSSQRLYTCSSNGFHGCCSGDPCGLGGCLGNPDPKKATPSEKSSSSSQNTQQASIAAQSSTSQTSKAFSQPNPGSTTEGQPTSRPTASTSTTLPGNTLAPTVVLITSTIVNSQTSKGTSLTTYTSIFSSTTFLPPTPAPLSMTGTESSTSSSTKKIIGGVIGGIGGVIATLLCIWLCSLFRKKRIKRRNEPIIDDDPRFQGIDANRAGDAIENYDTPNVRGKKSRHNKSKEQLIGSTTRIKGNGNEHKRKWPWSFGSPAFAKSNEDVVPYLDSQPIRPDLEMEGSSADPIGLKAELSGIPPMNPIAELSPNPERSYINNPNRLSASAWSGNDADIKGNISSNPDRSLMRPNLSNSPPSADHENAPMSGGNRHVMSWMNYEDAGGHTKTTNSTTD